jgi:hypothetical protein
VEYIKIGIILLFCFFLRRIFIITKSSDVSVHLWHIKKSKIFGFGKHNAFNSIFDGTKGYPSLPHFILSLFPEKKWIRIGYLLNIIYDCINIFIVYFAAKFIFSRNFIPINNQFIEPHLMAVLLYGTAPIMLPYTSRLKSFGGRTFGNLMNIIYFSSLGMLIITNNYFSLFFLLLSGILIILSSSFGMQVMIFFSIILSIIYLTIIPIVMLAFIFLIGIFFPFLGIKDILRFKLNHYIWYKKNYQKGTTAADRNRLIDFIQYPLYAFKDRKKFFVLSFKRLTPIIAAYSLPALVFLIYWFAVDSSVYFDLVNNEVNKYLLSITFASIVIFFITSLKWFSFLGEAERYFEYSAWAITLLFVIVCYKNNYYNLLIYLLILHVCIVLINFTASVRQNIRKALRIEENKNLEQILEFLKSKSEGRVLSIPTKLNFILGYFISNSLKFYYQFIVEDKINGFKKQCEDEIVYNYIIPDFEHFIDKYMVNIIVVEKKAIRASKKKYNLDYNFSKFKITLENEEFLIYEL